MGTWVEQTVEVRIKRSNDACENENFNIQRFQNSEEYQIFAEYINDNKNDSNMCKINPIGNFNNLNFVSAVPNLIFAFMCITTAFPIYQELHGNVERHFSKGNPIYTVDDIFTKSRNIMTKVVTISMIIVAIIYLLVATCGYLTWRNAMLTSDILLAYSFTHPDSNWIIVARLCSLICVIFSAPLLHYPCRRALTVLMFDHENVPDSDKFSWKIHLGTMVINIILIASILLYGSQNIGQLFNYSGSIAANSLLIILPSLCYLKAFPVENFGLDHYEPGWRRIVCKFLVVFGFSLMIFCIGLTLKKDGVI